MARRPSPIRLSECACTGVAKFFQSQHFKRSRESSSNSRAFEGGGFAVLPQQKAASGSFHPRGRRQRRFLRRRRCRRSLQILSGNMLQISSMAIASCLNYKYARLMVSKKNNSGLYFW